MDLINYLNQIDKEVFLFLNGFHSPVSDAIMVFFTDKRTWIPFYVLIIAYYLWKFKWRGLLPIGSIVLAIILADHFASSFCKPFFERLRPCHQPEIAHLVHTTIKGCGGKYSFISSHAANTFALAMFLFQYFRQKIKYAAWIFLWSGLVSYSRIAVGVHYPGDIIVGAASGMLWGYLAFLIFQFAKGKLEWENP